MEHLHHRTGKSKIDDTYEEGRRGRSADDVCFLSLH